MDVVQIINELRQELERIDSLILALDSLQTGRRRGRPPKLLQQLRAARSGSADDLTPVKKTRKKRKAASKAVKKSAEKKVSASP
ncbi:MAG: hypothetical protein WD733_06555 [Bryobacterales bacterium]